jgi:translocation and assembly module TamA
VPDIRRKDQDYLLDARVAREDQEGFTSTETVSTLRVERRFADIYSASAGFGIDRSVVEENAAERDFTLLVLPFALRRDTTDSLLDPTTGGLATLTVTPSFGMLGTDTDFYVARLFDSVHYRLTDDKTVILAGWGRVSTVLGDDTLALPANRRIYAGGAGSVRGYPLDSIGRLDAQNDPVGGRSATEAGLELRWKVSDPFGVVGFVETGGVYDKAFPDWGQDLQWGAGIGVRYYSAIGPLRLDVAVPLNRRNEIDDAFQILVSLGQAF